MTWFHPSPGYIRLRRRFLWLPKRIQNETRWLEIAEWRESYSVGYWSGLAEWVPMAWLPFNTPRGSHHSAQGCAPSATLGNSPQTNPQP
jgi:hypothetical protein